MMLILGKINPEKLPGRDDSQGFRHLFSSLGTALFEGKEFLEDPQIPIAFKTTNSPARYYSSPPHLEKSWPFNNEVWA